MENTFSNLLMNTFGAKNFGQVQNPRQKQTPQVNVLITYLLQVKYIQINRSHYFQEKQAN